MTAARITDQALDRLFRTARSANGFINKDVSDDLLRQAYDLAKFGPTAANSCPMRIVFVKSKEAKEKLKPCMSPGNADKTMSAPVTAIIGMDMEFYEQLPKLFPHADARSWFAGNDAAIEETAFRNSSLQGAYFMLAARAVGLDCGPMSGFDAARIEAAFFPGGKVRANFVCNLGYIDDSKTFPRHPRLDFSEACQIV